MPITSSGSLSVFSILPPNSSILRINLPLLSLIIDHLLKIKRKEVLDLSPPTNSSKFTILVIIAGT